MKEDEEEKGRRTRRRVELTMIPPTRVRTNPAWNESSERSPKRKLLILTKERREEGKRSWLEGRRACPSSIQTRRPETDLRAGDFKIVPSEDESSF